MRSPRPGVSKLHQTAGWSARRSATISSSAVERHRVVDAERRRRGVGAEADAVPHLALGVLRTADERRAPVAVDHEPGARLAEAGEVVEVAAVAIRVVVVAVALTLGRGRHDGDAAAGLAHRRGDAGPAGGERREGGSLHGFDCSGRQGQNRGRGIRTPQREGTPCPCNTGVSARAACKVSELSLGSWITYHTQVDVTAAKEMLAAAMDAGVNFFDNAEVYARGQSEVVMGEAIKALKWPRLNYVVSTKFFWGLEREGNTTNRMDTLNRKYLTQAIDGSLKRMQLDFIDLVFCHRSDPHTPIEETVWAMSDMITRGKALYWGT